MTSTKGGAGQTLGDSCDAVFAVVGQFMRNWGWTIAVLKFSGLSGLPAKDWWEKTHQSEGANTPHTDHEITCGWLQAWFLPARTNDGKFFVLGWARKAPGGLYPELVCQGLKLGPNQNRKCEKSCRPRHEPKPGLGLLLDWIKRNHSSVDLQHQNRRNNSLTQFADRKTWCCVVMMLPGDRNKRDVNRYVTTTRSKDAIWEKEDWEKKGHNILNEGDSFK